MRNANGQNASWWRLCFISRIRAVNGGSCLTIFRPLLSSILKVCKCLFEWSSRLWLWKKRSELNATQPPIVSAVCWACFCSQSKFARYQDWNLCNGNRFSLVSYDKKICEDGGCRKTLVEEVKKYPELEVEISEKITPYRFEQKLRIQDVVSRSYGQNFSYPYIETFMNTPSKYLFSFYEKIWLSAQFLNFFLNIE